MPNKIIISVQAKYVDILIQTINQIHLTASKLHYLFTILAQIFPVKHFREGVEVI